MSDYNQQMIEKYRGNFLREVEANVEEGDWVKMCMQCGVCSGSCPLGPHWDHPPQEIFMMIRANKRDEVLASTSMWMCTSCYNCIARCPRGLPITHIMHGLAHYAKRVLLALAGRDIVHHLAMKEQQADLVVVVDGGEGDQRRQLGRLPGLPLGQQAQGEVHFSDRVHLVGLAGRIPARVTGALRKTPYFTRFACRVTPVPLPEPARD